MNTPHGTETITLWRNDMTAPATCQGPPTCEDAVRTGSIKVSSYWRASRTVLVSAAAMTARYWPGHASASLGVLRTAGNDRREVVVDCLGDALLQRAGACGADVVGDLLHLAPARSAGRSPSSSGPGLRVRHRQPLHPAGTAGSS